MIVYHQNLQQFLYDVLHQTIADTIHDELSAKGIGTSPSEFKSWENSLFYMRSVLELSSVPNDAMISIEYQIPLTAKRVDFIVTGADSNDNDNVVIIELKQWSDARKLSDIQDHTVEAFVGGAYRPLEHPSYKAYSYKEHIINYSETVKQEHLNLVSCTYCHNFDPSKRYILEDKIYSKWIKEAPLFVKGDIEKLADFISKKICKKAKNGDLLYDIDEGKIRPSKALQDCLDSMLSGNQEFMLLDEQATVYDRCIKAYSDYQNDKKKRVLIIKGGPGTGKSVLAINLLVDFIKRGANAAYCTKNSAPRDCYKKILSKGEAKKSVAINEVFRSPFGLADVPNDIYDVLLVDEAHRLVKQMFRDFHGKNQIDEIIKASKVSIFFIDESQQISTKDIGTINNIISIARQNGINDFYIENDEYLTLKSEFRCNGSDAYMAFLNDLLGLGETANKDISDLDFDFKVFDSPIEMKEELAKHNENNKARMVAGYTYDWNVKNHRGDYDIVIGDFKAKWNNEKKSSLWLIRKDSFDEIGCIHTCQGLELDYVGVIIGKDLIYRDGVVKTDRNAVSEDDNSSGIRKTKDLDLADRLIRNTYKVLLSRGQKGCYIYCEDKALGDYIRSRIVKK